MKNLLLLGGVLSLLACKKPEPPPAALPPPPKAPHAASPVAPDAGAIEQAAKKEEEPPTVEVELDGPIEVVGKGKEKVDSMHVYLTTEPCLPVPEKVKALTTVKASGARYGHEFFPDVGSSAHACAVALDAQRRAIAFGAYEKNPLRFEGTEELFFTMPMKLKRVAPRPLPEGLELEP